jgi:AraC-like DNA-binding protein
MWSDFILFGGIFLSLIFTLHLFTYKLGNILLNRLLGLLFLGRALNSGIVMINSISAFEGVQRILFSLQLLLFLLPAVFFLYMKSFLLDQSRLNRTDLFHLVPFFLVFMLVFIAKSQIAGINIIFSDENLAILLLLFRAFLFLVYLIFCWRLFFKKVRDDQHKINRTQYSWLYIMLSIISISQLFQLGYSCLVSLGHLDSPYPFASNRFSFITGLASTFFVIFVLRNPNVLYGNIVPRLAIGPENTTEELSQFSSTQSDVVVPSGELLETDQMQGYFRMIENYMVEHDPYLDPSFSLTELSQKLSIPLHHCSYVLNQGIGLNFREYINRHRVNFFIKEYPNRVHAQTMESIANLSGFKSSSTFYSAFKKETGTSPVHYFS